MIPFFVNEWLQGVGLILRLNRSTNVFYRAWFYGITIFGFGDCGWYFVFKQASYLWFIGVRELVGYDGTEIEVGMCYLTRCASFFIHKQNVAPNLFSVIKLTEKTS